MLRPCGFHEASRHWVDLTTPTKAECKVLRARVGGIWRLLESQFPRTPFRANFRVAVY
jgi:hypothetical protein